MGESTTDKRSKNESGSGNLVSFFKDCRGQTLFDFVVGISLFLFLVAGIVVFIPNLLDPFEPSSGASTVLADRGADHLTQTVMRASGEGPYVLDSDCTVALFSGVASTECPVESDGLREITGMSQRSNVNAELTDMNGDTVTIDGEEMVVGNDIDDGGSGSVYTATRVVTVSGERYELVFRVWS